MYQFKQPIPLSLYIHFPWCVKKCPYCDFNSHELKQEIPEQLYISRLIADLESHLPQIWGRRLVSIFMGGGTPSLFSAAAMEQLLDTINTRIAFSREIEITLEANPGTVDTANFQGYRAAGINRLSIGVQSFQADKLKVLGRIHNAEAAIRAVQMARTAGFENFNIDLMYGLPQQTVTDATYDLETAIQLAPSHLSWYQLTLEPNTLFHKMPPPLPAESLIDEIQEAGYAMLAAADFNRYEVSAYSQPQRQAQHNLNYWEFGDYLGIGAGAHGKLTDMAQQQVLRTSKRKHPKDYLNPSLSMLEESKIIPIDQIPFEFMLNALRLEQAISIELLESRTGLTLTYFEKYLKNAVAKGLLNWNNEQICLTILGKRFLNDVIAEFLP